MSEQALEREAETVRQRLAPGPRLAVIGSASFWEDSSREICTEAGAQLAAIDDLVLLTGGVSGVGEGVGRSFFEARCHSGKPAHVFHVLPQGFDRWDYGETLFAGSSIEERREILARLAPVYLSIEGGPGTAHEAEVARSAGAIVIPIGRTGGCSADLYRQARCPRSGLEADWTIMNNGGASASRVGLAVKHVVSVLLNDHTRA